MTLTTSIKSKLGRALAGTLAACAIAAPTAVAIPQDLRMPDTRDAAEQSQQQQQGNPGYQDLRSPDTRDAAIGYAPVASDVSTTTESSSSGNGFDWASAAIGAAIGAGLLVLVVMVTGMSRPAPRLHGRA